MDREGPSEVQEVEAAVSVDLLEVDLVEDSEISERR